MQCAIYCQEAIVTGGCCNFFVVENQCHLGWTTDWSKIRDKFEQGDRDGAGEHGRKTTRYCHHFLSRSLHEVMFLFSQSYSRAPRCVAQECTSNWWMANWLMSIARSIKMAKNGQWFKEEEITETRKISLKRIGTITKTDLEIWTGSSGWDWRRCTSWLRMDKTCWKLKWRILMITSWERWGHWFQNQEWIWEIQMVVLISSTIRTFGKWP